QLRPDRGGERRLCGDPPRRGRKAVAAAAVRADGSGHGDSGDAEQRRLDGEEEPDRPAAGDRPGGQQDRVDSHHRGRDGGGPAVQQPEGGGAVHGGPPAGGAEVRIRRSRRATTSRCAASATTSSSSGGACGSSSVVSVPSSGPSGYPPSIRAASAPATSAPSSRTASGS